MTFLKSYGVKVFNADLSVFVKSSLIVAIYINNLQITRSSFAEIYIIKQVLNKRFHVLNLGPYQYYLSMTATCNHKNQILRLD